MKKITAAIDLAEHLQDRIDSHDAFCDLMDAEEEEARYNDIIAMADALALECDALIPIPGLVYHDLLPAHIGKVLTILQVVKAAREA